MKAPGKLHHRFDQDSELMIDAVRGIAAVLVLITHAVDLSVVDRYGWDAGHTPELWRWVRASVGHGGYWVWCFFIVSGLCIHQSIARSVASGEFEWRKYALARITRIYPLFLLGLALAGITWALHEDWSAHPALAPWRQLVASLLSLQIITTPMPGFETSWSLSCEMIYYAVWPLLVVPFRGRVSAAVFAGLVGTVATLGAVLYLWRVQHRLETSAAVDGVWTVAVLFPVWLCGAWLAGHWPAVSSNVGVKLWLFSIVLCVGAEVLLAVLKFEQLPGWMVHASSWTAIPGLLVFLAGARHARLSRFRAAVPVCRWLGQLSYPCYILHMQLLLIWNHLLNSLMPQALRSNPWFNFPVLFIPIAAVLALLGPPLERAVMQWRRQVLARPAPAAASVSPA